MKVGAREREMVGRCALGRGGARGREETALPDCLGGGKLVGLLVYSVDDPSWSKYRLFVLLTPFCCLFSLLSLRLGRGDEIVAEWKKDPKKRKDEYKISKPLTQLS
ncbi:hypothetical protein BDV30DRAFT_213681 [Aspergillus minisclerotigenes]|uniref:Uncharacterized protein n=1 Tax=Aspergillus minisclerotigenes TaxID=656917 RepID=A0A5N6IZ48_9EURO|nr:hypothetical protein BDV30DRAFT_213681 [Aspergillus minisclerotigenes]